MTALGAVGDGVTDDTAAFEAAIAAANGAIITVPAGRYLLGYLTVTGRADFLLDSGATLVKKAPTATNRMIQFDGDYLRIRGGTIDGQRHLQTAFPSIVYGQVQTGKEVIFDGVHFTRVSRTPLQAREFGGYIQITNCEFTDQAEHSGISGQYPTLLDVTSGQVGAKGLIRFNHNRARFDRSPSVDGANPGGIFVATRPAGIADGSGNLSTVEAIGNHFYGYGLNAFGNDVSPIHTYPAAGQLRAIGNYFEKCGFCAISAKSAQDTIITGNTIVDGIYSSKNISSEGAISYAPGYHAYTHQRPRGVIANNIIANPGGLSVASKQHGIAVIGAQGSLADNVVVEGNVISGSGIGVYVRNARNVSILGNIIDGSADGTTGSENGMRFQNTIEGQFTIANNTVNARNGIGINLHDADSTGATFTLTGNTVKQTSTSAAINMRGAKVVKMSGNTLDAATRAMWVGADTSARNIGHFAYDSTNTIVSGSATIQWGQIAKATGQLFGAGSPLGVITPGEPGTTYRRTDGRENTLWIARDAGAAWWTPVVDQGVGTPTIVVGSAAGAGATAKITGTDNAGVIEVTPGNGGSPGGICAVTFSQVRRENPRAIMLMAGSTAAAAAANSVAVFPTSMSTTQFLVSATGSGLGAGLHSWHYIVL
ncbi:right-handed parallel beta-helix repeat-containing protein [Dietzia kunjamensis]|uniref:right-handed parallel beta-helix repeat-containing protein n=1 Tax=Dietzia kunjamensis TaxID=322509 RepID=UPI0038908D1B